MPDCASSECYEGDYIMALPSKGYFGGGKYNVGGNVVQFDPTPFIGVVLSNVSERLEACGSLFVEMAKANFVFAYPPHSMPWDFPHYNEGGETMKDHIDYTVFDRGAEIVMQAGIVSDDLPGRLNIYPGMLETGTILMAPRPWLTITLDEVWLDWGAILTGMGSL